jgi:hypothetical protein
MSTIFSRAFTRGMAQSLDVTGAIASRRLAQVRRRDAFAGALSAHGQDLQPQMVDAERVGWRNHGLRRQATA